MLKAMRQSGIVLHHELLAME